MTEKQPMTWNKDEGGYYGITSDGQKIRVEHDAYLLAQRDQTAEDITDPDWWALLVASNPQVTIVNEVV